MLIFQLQLRNTGYSEPQLVEICAALSVLAKYGILAMGLGIGGAHAGALPTVSSYLSVMDQAGAAAAATANTGAVFGPIGQVSLGECLGNKLYKYLKRARNCIVLFRNYITNAKIKLRKV